MSLKTATLIALIGLVVHFCLVIAFSMFGVTRVHRFSPTLGIVIPVFSMVIHNGSLILFLAAFYSKQRE